MTEADRNLAGQQIGPVIPNETGTLADSIRRGRELTAEIRRNLSPEDLTREEERLARGAKIWGLPSAVLRLAGEMERTHEGDEGRND